MNIAERLAKGSAILETVERIKGKEHLSAVVIISRLDMLVTDYNKAIAALLGQSLPEEAAIASFKVISANAYDVQMGVMAHVLKNFKESERQEILKDAKALRDSTDAKT